MKTAKWFLFVLLISGLTAQAQTSVDRAAENYLKALKSDNPALVESAVFHVVKLQMFHPEQRDYRITGQLITIINSTEDEDLKKKATLALKYIQYPELLDRIERRDYKDGIAFFERLAEADIDYPVATR